MMEKYLLVRIVLEAIFWNPSFPWTPFQFTFLATAQLNILAKMFHVTLLTSTPPTEEREITYMEMMEENIGMLITVLALKDLCLSYFLNVVKNVIKQRHVKKLKGHSMSIHTIPQNLPNATSSINLIFLVQVPFDAKWENAKF